MKAECPYCQSERDQSDTRSRVVRQGHFRRKSDYRWVQKFQCRDCRKYFSRATKDPCFGQNKRHINKELFQMLASCSSIRRASMKLRVNRKTVARKLKFLGQQALLTLDNHNKSFPTSTCVEFDDMETFEHTKCKPLSITLAVEKDTRRILGFEVSQMPATGLLSKKSIKKYGYRPDHRRRGRTKLIRTIKNYTAPNAIVKSDENPFYIDIVKRELPHVTHQRFKGQRGATTGQGELKKVQFDPLFSINHTCAMLRANINRLFRKTWCTTKRKENLRYHIAIYAVFHNIFLI